MDHPRTSFLVFLGLCLSSFLLLYECRKLNGYKFPVYTTEYCPKNETEWEKRSSAFNCKVNSSYACFPNDEITELLEFCYPLRLILIHKGVCLYLRKDRSEVDSYNCLHFAHGCPTDPSCVLIGNGCFLAELSCKGATEKPIQRINKQHTDHQIITDNTETSPDVTETPFQGTSSDELSTDSSVWVMIFAPLLTIFFVSVVVTLLLLFFRRRKLKSRKNNDEENSGGVEQQPLLGQNPDINFKDTEYENSIFNQWAQDDACFYPTKAAKQVENMIKHNNLVVVTGHSGYGKSAIIQHIALEYRKQGWTVKPVYTFEEIHTAYKSESFQKERSMFVFNDPIGKESFDVLLFDQWKRYRETINILIKEVKLLLTCRQSIISDQKAEQFLEGTLEIEIDNSKYALNSEEKKAIFKRHMPDEKLTENEFAQISEVGIYFPLLCKLCKAESKHTKNKLQFFKNPKNVLKKELKSYKENHKEEYCGLVCLVLNNNEVCLDDLERNPGLLSTGIQLSGLPSHTSPNTIIRKLEYLQGFLVKRIEEKFTFYHDFVMEVTTSVFGTEYPEHIIKFADLSFLRKRIILEKTHNKAYDPFTIYLSDHHVSSLVNRLFEELFRKRFIEVVLNPCLRNKQVISDMETMLNGLDEHKMLELVRFQETSTDKLNLETRKNDFSYSLLEFVCAETGLSPLFALIAFGHGELSMICLKLLRQSTFNLKRSGLFPALCCNGNEDLIEMFSKEEISECMEETWDNMYPIHVVSVFHNYKLLNMVDEKSTKVNMFTRDNQYWTPLILASRIRTEQQMKESIGSSRGDKTVECLIEMGADVNLCNHEGYSPLMAACEHGHEHIAQLLIMKNAKVNSRNEDGESPLLVACEFGHESIAKLLIVKNAEVNLCDYYGNNPLLAACQTGHNRIAELLIDKGLEVNTCNRRGNSPLYMACTNGHESTAELLIKKNADVNLCDKSGRSPLHMACECGNESIAKLLIKNNAELNLCDINGKSPLYMACEFGNESTAELLIKKNADVNLCDHHGNNPLLTVYLYELNSIAELLIEKGLAVNTCNKEGHSPLYMACCYGNESVAELLIKKNADVNFCDNYGNNLLLKACKSGLTSIAELLIEKGLAVNTCNKQGESPLYMACKHGHESTAELFIKKNADVNLCDNDGNNLLLAACGSGLNSIAELLIEKGMGVNTCNKHGESPLYMACSNGQESTSELLIMKNADVNLCKNDGISPLWIACKSRYEETVQLLLKHDASVNLCNIDKVSPLWITCGYENYFNFQRLTKSMLKDLQTMDTELVWQKRQESIAQVLLYSGADVNFCNKDAISPLLQRTLKNYAL
uniref:Uncharacterized protein LOC111114568 isoform X2 n=1 Tax=Crassostrea virginica TaxID=6565 RepID=A0A8B8BZA6_CRAVI|nr:uncharacterized protein LOC111114568 isoform X2 [Crassostrea virginica]